MMIFDMVAMENVSNQYLGGDASLTCSFETQTLLDKKVVELVRREHGKGYEILTDNIGSSMRLPSICMSMRRSPVRSL